MTTLYEAVCHGPEHAPFNAALIATVLEAFPGEGVTFCGEASHVAAVQWMLSDAGAGVRWAPMVIAPRVCESTRVRLGYEWRTVAQTLDELHRTASARLIACAATAPGLAALKCRIALMRHPPRIAVIHHSALAALVGSRSTRALVARGNGTRIRHVVLGRYIRDTAVTRFPELETCVFSMRHPYLFPAAPAPAWPTDGCVRFGFLGLANRDKGFDLFCRLASRATRVCGTTGLARFELVGRLASEYREARPEGSTHVSMPDAAMPLRRDVYDRAVEGLTYTVLPYAPAHYAMTSSGAILDAFVHVKPCIALRNPMMDDYFRAMGDIGYLCATEDEMADVVRAIVTSPPTSRYAAQCANILRGRAMFSPASVARELRFILPQPS